MQIADVPAAVQVWQRAGEPQQSSASFIIYSGRQDPLSIEFAILFYPTDTLSESHGSLSARTTLDGDGGDDRAVGPDGESALINDNIFHEQCQSILSSTLGFPSAAAASSPNLLIRYFCVM